MGGTRIQLFLIYNIIKFNWLERMRFKDLKLVSAYLILIFICFLSFLTVSKTMKHLLQVKR